MLVHIMGDTVKKFLHETKGKAEKIIAFEPDASNCVLFQSQEFMEKRNRNYEYQNFDLAALTPPPPDVVTLF